MPAGACAASQREVVRKVVGRGVGVSEEVNCAVGALYPERGGTGIAGRAALRALLRVVCSVASEMPDASEALARQKSYPPGAVADSCHKIATAATVAGWQPMLSP